MAKTSHEGPFAHVGRLKHRVTLQSRTLSEDSFGQPIETWSGDVARWARVRPLRGRELEIAVQIRAETTHRVTLRARPDEVTPEMRLLFGDRVFQILSAIDVAEAGRRLELLCAETR